MSFITEANNIHTLSQTASAHVLKLGTEGILGSRRLLIGGIIVHLQAMQLEMKRANRSLKGSDVEARRMLTTLSASARRRLYAGGTRSEVTGGETSQVINSGWIPEDG